MIAIAPSILAADFAQLGNQVREVEKGGANRIHIDVMDGHFVPNLSMGPVVVKALRPITRLPLEVHLMITDPTKYAKSFLDAGANTIIFHLEVLPDPLPLIQAIHARGGKAGVAINPATPVDALKPWLAELDLVLCMTVWPGFGGQAFLPESPGRIQELRNLINAIHSTCELEVDGGIDLKTAATSVVSGANVLVAGTSIFGASHGPLHAMGEFLRLFPTS